MEKKMANFEKYFDMAAILDLAAILFYSENLAKILQNKHY